MIEVNLLPEDRRPVERTPLPRFLVILVGVVGVSVEALILMVILTRHPQKVDLLKDINRKIDLAQTAKTRIKAINRSIKEIGARNKEINNLYRFRRTWAPLLHRISSPEVLPRNIWYREIELKQGRGVRGKAPLDELFLSGYAGGSPDDGANSMYQGTQAINALVENLKLQGEDFKSNFKGNLDENGETILNPEKTEPTELKELSPGKKSSADVPRQATKFQLKLVLKAKKASALAEKAKKAGEAGQSN